MFCRSDFGDEPRRRAVRRSASSVGQRELHNARASQQQDVTAEQSIANNLGAGAAENEAGVL